MKCPYCSNNESKVVDKRDTDDFGIIRRRRECLSCGKRFTTYEKLDMADVMVIKKDGRREPFDPEKLKRGIMRACEKRPINIHQIDTMVLEIEDDIHKQNLSEVRSDLIGSKVIDALKSLDKVACIRFASVYRSFQSISEFEREVQSLLQTK
jgi:transcriptional repressor NrdR